MKRFPFRIRLTDRSIEDSDVQTVLAKTDPGSRYSGFAVVRTDEKEHHHALFFIDLLHRGELIRDALSGRSACLRRRRGNLRHRAPRLLNRTRPQDWLLRRFLHRRADTATAWPAKLIRLAPVTGIVKELVKFDVQKLLKPEISGTEYRLGTLFGYEVREYLFEKFDLPVETGSMSLRASKTSEDCHRKDAGDIPTTNAARGPHDTCGRTKERDRFSSRVKTLPENPRRTAVTTGIPTRTLPASPDGKHPHRTGTSQRPSAADFPATRPKIRQSTIETVPRRTIPWTPPVISPAA